MKLKFKRIISRKTGVRIASVLLAVVLMCDLFTIVANAISYYTVRINYCYADGTPAHDPYIATYNPGEALNYDVTNPNVSGFEPMALSDPNNDPAELPTGGVSAETTHIESNSLNGDITYTVYYIAGLTHYAARYYLQNIYDDLYTLDRDRTDANQNRLGKTGATPDDLESEKIPGFTSLFHEPDAIAADGSTVFRVYYDRNYYSVNFDLGDGGYGVDPIYAKYQTVYRIEEPKRMGYTFRGWARTSGDSSKGEEGVDWSYIKPDAVPEIDENGHPHYAAEDCYADETEARQHLVQFQDRTDLTVPYYNSNYKAIWDPGTSSLSVLYWFENADNNGYTPLLARDVDKVRENGQMVDVVAGTTITPNTVVSNYAEKARQEGVYNSSTGCKSNINITDFFSFNLNYADPDNANNEDPDPDAPGYDPDAFVYKYDTSGVPIDFKDISKGTSEELAGCGDFFELNTAENTSDPRYVTDTSVTVRGDGTTRFNVFFKRKTFTLKFYYARQGYTKGALDPDKISLTNSTKKFNCEANDAQYLNTTSKNPLEAIAEGTWERNTAESLPTVKDEYKQRVTEGYDDFTDNGKGYYRYYYYQVQAKYNESLKDKWLIDALNSVHRKNADPKEICIPGSIAAEYYNRYYQDRASSPNYTVKGVYEKLGKGILFTDSARNTMKQNNIDYTELHFLISWTNTSNTNGWNSSISNVLHFRYENYTELLPREIEIVENNGVQALLAEGNYTSVRTFTTKVKENGNWIPKTKWYGLSTDHIYETIDSGNVYNSPSSRDSSVYTNQTPTAMTGFELEYYRETNGYIKLDRDNTELDWSQDTNDYRRCIIKFFYRRLSYTLKYRNGNRKDESHTRTVMYGAPINSVYQVSENGHNAGDYRYYWPDPEYFDENRRGFYTFDGWYNDTRYEDPFDLDTQTMPADDYTLFAKWSPKNIDVIFYDDYDDFYIDRKGDHPEKRVVLGKDDDDNDIRDINVDYGSYVPLMSIPVNDDSPDNPRPKLTPIAEGASFAGWYYIRNRVPVRYEPENVPVTALNEESVGDNAKLRLFAEWVTKDVAKYKVSYVKDSDGTEIAAPTTGRAYVWKTKTFNAKSGDELYDEYKWSQEGEDEGTNWWPTTNSSSMVIKANNSDDEFAPNNLEFRYIQKNKVYYKVQYLDAATRKPLNVEGGDVIKESTHASVSEDARIIPGYIARTATQSIVLTASSESDPEAQQAEELEYNVITFLYDENVNEYMYEVEYLTQDLGANTYSLYTSETLTVQKTGDGAVSLPVANLYNNDIPQQIIDAGFTRVSGGTKYTVTNAEGVRDPTLNPVADDGTVAITGTDKKTIMIYFSRNSYSYKYQYVDQTAEKAYLNYLEAHKNDPDPTAGAPWNGVLATFDDPSFTGQVQQTINIDPERDYKYTNPTTSEEVDYTRVTDENGALKDVTLTIQPENSWNIVKIYYRKDIERELNYKMVCVNNNPDTDYYQDGTPKFGRLNVTMQTVQDYNGIQNNTFFDTNNEVIDNTDPSHPVYLHLHRYTFLGWYTTPTYNEANPAENRITTNATLSKEDLPTGTELPDNRTKYYALVKQDMVKMDVMFYYTDDYTVDEFKSTSDETLSPIIQQAVNNADNAQASDTQKVHPTGEHVGKEVTFTAPNGYQNHTEIPWHRNDGYSLSMTDTDNRVYKYQFAEWWEIAKDRNDALVRHLNWNSEEWDPDSLSQQIARNYDKYFIAVYARREVDSLPYTVNYNYTDRQGEPRTYVAKGTLTGDELKEGTSTCKITNDGDYRLTDEFIVANSPFESNYGETLRWSDKEIQKTSVKGNGTNTQDQLTATVTAVQSKKTVFAHYRLTPNGTYDTDSNPVIRTFYGANRELDPQMNVLLAPETYDGKAFSYWAVRKSNSDSAPVIAKSYDRHFDLCMMDSYFLTPVYEGAAVDPGANSDPGDTGDPADPPAETQQEADPTITLTHLDYTRNRWTDDEGEVAASGETDLLYTDFEIAFEDNKNQIYNTDGIYQAGVVFERIGKMGANTEFDPDLDYGYLSDAEPLKAAILNGDSSYTTTNKVGSSATKNRKIQLSPINTHNMTNRNRIEFAQYYKNAYTLAADGETKNYSNSQYLLKATAYLIKDGKVYLSNSVYVCLKGIAAKDNATGINNIWDTTPAPTTPAGD